MNPYHELRVFLCATSIIVMCAAGFGALWDKTMKEPVVACAIEFKGYDGNKHVYVGSGEVW